LRRRVTINWTGRVVLESSRYKLTRCFRRVDVPDASLGIPLQFGQRRPDAFLVRLPHAVVTTHKGSDGYRLRRGKRGVPPGAMLYARHLTAILAFIRSGNLMTNELLFCLGVLAFAQPRELFRVDWPSEIPLSGEPALPFAVALLVPAPVVLLLRSKLFCMVRARLAG